MDHPTPYFELALDNEEDLQRPVTRVFRHVLLLARFFQDVIAEVAERHQLQPGDFLVVMTLARHPRALRPTELYRSLLVTSGAMTKRIDRLEAAGLLTRVDHGGDARSLPVALTHLGKEIASRVRAERNVMHDVAEAFGPDRIEALDGLLRDYIATVRAVEERDQTSG